MHTPSIPNLSSNKSILSTLAIALIGLCALSTQAAAAVNMVDPGTQVIEGRIGKIMEPGLFFIQGADGVKVLVYTNREATDSLETGHLVRVTGKVPVDYSRLSDQELQSRQIEKL
jgi:hypothetical protein